MFRILVVCVFCALTIQCGKRVVEPESGPSVTIQFDGFSNDGDTIHKQSVLFNWAGDGTINEFRYNIDSTGWSPWSDIVKTYSVNLDEGRHTFEVCTRYKEEVDSVVKKVSFVVDALKGPSLAISPCSTTTANDTVNLGIVSDGLIGCRAIQIKLSGVTVIETFPIINATDSTKPGVVTFNNHIFTVVPPSAASIAENGTIIGFKGVLEAGQKETEVKIEASATDSSGNIITLKTMRSGKIVRK
jgi:hypothetical protein